MGANILKEVYKSSRKPDLYSPGNASMWTDGHISKQLLKLHLDEHVDLASRKPGTIKKTVDWILSHTHKTELDILDLGCGPGLYAEILARKGHRVTGVDFSENSINYARQAAGEKNLDITYICKDYTKLNLPEDHFDLALLIFTDFGTLLPNERQQLLGIIRKVLRPGGFFVFDVLNDNEIENKLAQKNWEICTQGFWSDKPYLYLSESFLYQEDKLILYQHTVVNEEESIRVYRFWTHFFSNSDLAAILKEYDFKNISFHQGIVPSGDGYDSSDVTLCTASA